MFGVLGSGDYDEDSLEDGDEEQELMDFEVLLDFIDNEVLFDRDVENLEQVVNLFGIADVDEFKEMCSICGYEFSVSYMVFYMKVYEGQKFYSCFICGKRFGYKNNMKFYIKFYVGIKFYQCLICGVKFIRGLILRRYVRRYGIFVESVWDFFVKNSVFFQENMLLLINGNDGIFVKNNSSSMFLYVLLDERKEEVIFYVDLVYSSFFNIFILVVMLNVLFMSYQNYQVVVAVVVFLFSSIFNILLLIFILEIFFRFFVGFLEISYYIF